MIQDRIKQDLKAALLAGDSFAVTVLRGLQSALLYVAVAEGKRDTGLSDEKVIEVIGKEAKKRQESIALYSQAGDMQRAGNEERELTIIRQYLPEQLNEAALTEIVTQVFAEHDFTSIKDMGPAIAAVKQKTAGQADGAVIARIVKDKLQ